MNNSKLMATVQQRICSFCFLFCICAGALSSIQGSCGVIKSFGLRNPDHLAAELVVTLSDTVLFVPLTPVIKREQLGAGEFELVSGEIRKGSCATLNYTWGPEENETKSYSLLLGSDGQFLLSDSKGTVLVSLALDRNLRNGTEKTLWKSVKIEGDFVHFRNGVDHYVARLPMYSGGGIWQVPSETRYVGADAVIIWQCRIDTLSRQWCGCDGSRRSPDFDIFKDNPECTQSAQRTIHCVVKTDPQGLTMTIQPYKSNFSPDDFSRLDGPAVGKTLKVPMKKR